MRHPLDEENMVIRTLIVGYGYLGQRVAKLCRDQGDHVFATTRSTDKFEAIADAGHIPVKLDWNIASDCRNLPTVDRILIAISYDRGSNVDRETSMVGGLSRLLRYVPATTSLCYISTTGVYHQGGGQWVDESSPTRPQRDGGKAHLRAESLLRDRRTRSGKAGRYVILRLSGIYGPGRIPRAADVRAGHPIASPSEGYLNLIHVDDAALAVRSGWRYAETCDTGDSKTFVVSDDCPVVRSEFYEAIAHYYHAPPPKFIQPSDDAPVRFRSESNKRIWNRRMKRDLVSSLAYPTYREGLINVLAGT
ncbi:NAD-dependent epimerase/dehydratase family protein [Rubripirellula amarantea]|nr:NAD-dependent epimerase/dehydratase family protein [Rubripirellula amarantea]